MASRAELGKHDHIDINKKILNYLRYLQDKYDNSIVKQSLQMSIALFTVSFSHLHYNAI